MGIRTKSALQTTFETGDKPTQADFANLIDTMVAIPTANATGLVEIESTASSTTRTIGAFGVQIIGAATTASARGALAIASAGSVGDQIFASNTTASAVGHLGATSLGTAVLQAATTTSALGNLGGTTVGQALFLIASTAAAQSRIGGGAIGIAIFEAATTASATNIVGAVTNDMLLYQDQATSGTAGPAYTSGAWRTVIIDTEVTDTAAIGSLASNQITLAAGSYEFDAQMAIESAGLSPLARLRLQNITAASTVSQGPQGQVTATGGDSTFTISGSFVIAGSTVFELQVYPTADLDGVNAMSSGEVEVYTSLRFRRYAT